MPIDFLPVFESKVKFNHNNKLPREIRMIFVGVLVQVNLFCLF